MDVQLLGKPAEFSASDVLRLTPAPATGQDLVQALVDRVPALREQILDERGRAVRACFLLAGGQRLRMDDALPEGRPLTFMAPLPCDG